MTQELWAGVIALLLIALGGLGIYMKAWFDTQSKKLEDKRLADVETSKLAVENGRAEIEERLSRVESDKQSRESVHDMIAIMKSMLEQHGRSLEQNAQMMEQIGKNTMALNNNTKSVDNAADAVGDLIERTQRMQDDMKAVLTGLSGIGKRLDDANLPEITRKIGSLVGEIEDVVKRHLADVVKDKTEEAQDVEQKREVGSVAGGAAVGSPNGSQRTS